MIRSNLAVMASTTALVACLGLAAQAQDRVLRIAPGAPPAHPANGVLYTNFAQYLPEESDGRLGAQILGVEVVNLGQMKDALQSQVAEVGSLLPLYFPAELPYMALAGELSLTSTNSQAAAAAMTQFIVECEPCQAEQRDFGFVYLGSGASEIYDLMTTRPVVTAEDMQGLRLRSGGAPWARFAEHFGAVPAQISITEQFEALSQGVVDGTMGSSSDLISFRLLDVITDVTLLPMGLYQATSNFQTNAQTWASLSEDDRAAMARAANRANADFTDRWGRTMEEDAMNAAREAGITIHEADADFVAAIEAFVATESDTAARISAERFGIADAETHIARFHELYAYWEGVAEELGNDSDAMAARIQDEVWSQVDYASYGL